MGDLSFFLAQNVAKAENEKVVVSKRFLGADGKPIQWEVKAITSTEDEAIRKDCTKRVPIVGKKGQYTQETDYNMYLGKLAAACTVYPNLNDKILQDSYGVMGADAVLKRMLTAGEYATYLEKVQKVNGFDATMDELVDEAKN
ncbi:MAG: phage portal protein [bacterium]|nr:phage portal protein [bacterium]